LVEIPLEVFLGQLVSSLILGTDGMPS